MTIPTPTFKTLAERDVWWREHVIALNRLAVTDPQEWERLTIRIEGLLAAIERRQPEDWAIAAEVGNPTASASRFDMGNPMSTPATTRPQPHTEAAMLRARERFWRKQPGGAPRADQLAAQAEALEHRDEPVGEAA